MRLQFRLHLSTWLTLLAVLGLFVWLNLDHSRDAYNDRLEEGWRGGVRLGFPMTWWDAGRSATAQKQTDATILSVKPYGGWQWTGLAVDLLALLAALTLSAVAAEALVRRGGHLAANAEVRKDRLGAMSFVLAAIVIGLLIWLNLRVQTEVRLHADASPSFSQTMGWPLTTYLASQPDVELWARAQPQPPRAAEYLRYLEQRPDLRWRRSHWFLENIAANVANGLALVFGALLLWQRATRRSISAAAIPASPPSAH